MNLHPEELLEQQVRPEWLRACGALAPLDDDELVVIAGLAQVEDLGPGELVFDQGSTGEHIYVVVSGRVEVLRSGRRTAELGAGDYFGEMAMFNRSGRTAAVRTVEATRLAAISRPSLQPLLLRHEPAAVKLIQQFGTLTLARMQRADRELRERLAAEDPSLRVVLDEYRQLSRELLAGWALAYHAVGKPGKLAVVPTKPSSTAADLSVAYSPGVAEPCVAIRDDPEAAYAYTGKGRLVAVISNGTAVLGLGRIGALASKPVMEGKSVLFKRFADVDAFDIEVDETDPRALVDTVVRIAPTFGGINLEDIAAPDCFWIERECRRRLDIPVMHDDQHGTAIIVGAALLNASDLVGKALDQLRVVFSGAGAAGFATARHLVALGVPRRNMILTDLDGVVRQGREMPFYLREFASDTASRTLADAVRDADAFIGLSAADVLTPAMVRSMARDPIVFALANPVPEIDPQAARAARPDVIVATGRSDHPNQVNNVLAFPYVFRGALDIRATDITDGMKLAATHAIARLARRPVTAAAGFDGADLAFGSGYLIPKPFDRRLLPEVASAVAEAGMRENVGRVALELQGYRTRLVNSPLFTS
ncbi:cyclic nucleotide-binding domain-containing protein [Streptosporangiaceae bacterium NEAU-GS5]|nr:cyclic nucleotide-binding domain-containing protein [Streptosporangiaceae bacterium NEAU-GS5]